MVKAQNGAEWETIYSLYRFSLSSPDLDQRATRAVELFCELGLRIATIEVLKPK